VIGVDRDVDARGEAAEGFIGRVVDRFLDDVRGVGRPRVHPGPLLDGLQALEDADGRFLVGVAGQFDFPSLAREAIDDIAGTAARRARFATTATR
jgi:hypothetical protein